MTHRWIHTPEGDRRLLLTAYVTGTGVEGIDGYAFFVIALTKSDVRALLAKMDLVKALRTTDTQIEAIEWKEWTGDYWPEAVNDDDLEGTGDPFWAVDDGPSRTETDRLQVGADWLRWTATTKYTDAHVETADVTRTTLEQILTEAEEPEDRDV